MFCNEDTNSLTIYLVFNYLVSFLTPITLDVSSQLAASVLASEDILFRYMPLATIMSLMAQQLPSSQPWNQMVEATSKLYQ